MAHKKHRMVIVVDYHVTKELDGSADLRLPHRLDLSIRRTFAHVVAVDNVSLFLQPQEGVLPQM